MFNLNSKLVNGVVALIKLNPTSGEALNNNKELYYFANDYDFKGLNVDFNCWENTLEIQEPETRIKLTINAEGKISILTPSVEKDFIQFQQDIQNTLELIEVCLVDIINQSKDLI
jgi:hypothetical protein